MSIPPPADDPAQASSSAGPPDRLANRLRRANARGLVELVESQGRWLGIAEVRQTLLNPYVSAEVIEALAANRKLVTEYAVRAALARHPRTPQTIAMRFVSGLFWRDLLELSTDARVREAVRRLAEKYLIERLPRMAQGEKLALARRASERVSEALATLAAVDPNPRLLDALLGNPRMTESALMTVLESRRASPRALQRVAEDERWAPRYEVRLALCRNPRTPSRMVLGLLPTLSRDDLASVASLEENPWVVVHRAREILDEWPVDRFVERVEELAARDDVRIAIDAIDSDLHRADV